MWELDSRSLGTWTFQDLLKRTWDFFVALDGIGNGLVKGPL
jgi:hypothetical protein